MGNLLKTIVILFTVNFSLFAQGEGALYTSTFQQSSLLFGAGQIGVSIPNDEVLGYYFNPAILGYSGRTNHASVSFFPSKNDWFGFGDYKPTINSIGLNIGYNLQNSILDLPISVGFGYSNYEFSYGDFIFTSSDSPEPIGEYESYELYNSFSFGIGLDYLAKFNFGLSLKTYNSQLGARIIDGEVTQNDADGIMFDYGALMLVPISDLLLKNQSIAINNTTTIFPTINFSLGYSISNVGDEVYFIDEAQNDPLSRIARFGYTFDFGVGINFNKTRIKFLNYSFTAEANDILIEPSDEANRKLEYEGLFGEIMVTDNLIKLKSTAGVSIHKGHIFNILETVTVTSGRILEHRYQSIRKVSGLGFSTKGIFNYLSSYSNNKAIKFIAKYFDVSYFQSTYELENTFFDQNSISIKEISLHFKGFEI